MLLASCDNNENEIDPKIQDLYGQEVSFVTNRIADHSEAQFPRDEFNESDYATITNSDTFSVVFSANGQEVNIYPDSLGGQFLKWENNKLYFQLNEGLFAGGRFVVWTTDDGYDGEFTVYGSGVPIIGSFRGVISLN